MKKKLQRFSLYLVFLQIGLTLASNKKVTAEVGKKISLPCEDSTQDIKWNKNGKLFAKFSPSGGLQYTNAQAAADRERYKIPSRITNNLEITNVQLTDAGSFACVKAENIVKTLELIVFDFSAEPSDILLMSENLRLSITSSPVLNLDVSWLRDSLKIGVGPKLEVKNITVEQSGNYMCQIKTKDGVEARFSKTISVKGLTPSPTTVFMSGKRAITLPFRFNFKVRNSLQDGVKVIEGNVMRLSSTNESLHTLKLDSEAACWSQTCHLKTNPEDLSVNITNPKSGLYQMKIVLETGTRQKKLHRDICVANLTVSTSHNNSVAESTVGLLCGTNCIEKDWRLCWRHENISNNICGPLGNGKLHKEITVLQETSGTWTCGVLSGERTVASAKMKLEMPQAFLSSPLFWVTVGVGVIVFLIIVAILTIMIARHRRVRRARYRAWLIENLHQHRTCECDYKGFAAQRLRHNI
ncbi:T-cell surface glycoprotein CD4 [Eleutherodactylus coqui]|uniref:T-cell surface glycoprotein CD4 n=1 Tax=Eleutherodactylus coqui TaxID=57060 RepID=UPI003461D223